MAKRRESLNIVPKVYLAGPIVFYEDPIETFNKMKEICKKHGIEGIAPLDNQIGLEGLAPGKETVTAIVQADLDLMNKLDGGIFCLNPFRRSTEMDPGTAVEIGYMKAQKKPMSGWTTDGREYPEKVKAFFAEKNLELSQGEANEQGGTSGLTRDPDGIMVHSEGMVQNGMTQGSIELSGGAVSIDQDWEKAFEGAVVSIKEQLAERQHQTAVNHQKSQWRLSI